MLAPAFKHQKIQVAKGGGQKAKFKSAAKQIFDACPRNSLSFDIFRLGN